MTDSFSPYTALYEKPKGPGDARPTALRVLEDNEAVGKWQGRVILVTGGTSGIGLETARAFHATGADVYFTARDKEKGLAVLKGILEQSPGNGKLDFLSMDMDSLESVKAAARNFLDKSETLNILINSAGIMGTPKSATKDGFERQFGVNHLAHFALTALLLPTLVKSSTSAFNSRVISVSSAAHRYSSIVFDDINLEGPNAYEPYRAYGQSKTANIWTANYIDRVFGPKGVHALSVHPGAIWSGLYVHADPAMLAEWQRDADLMSQMQSPAQGAANSAWAAAGKIWEGRGGKYIASCTVAPPAVDFTAVLEPGFAPHAYDEEGEKRLWELSEEMTGIRPAM